MSVSPSLVQALASVENFHGSVSVFEGGRTGFEQARGWAHYHARIPNTPQTRFGIASGSKVFTAVAVLQLVESGRLTLETRVNDLLAPWKVHEDMTVRHLLTHTSGIPDYFDEEVMDDYEELWAQRPNYRFRKPEDFFPLFLDKPAAFPPGQKFAYSNGGYVVLGRLIEVLTGKGFPEHLTEAVFGPAGMSATGYFRFDLLPGNTALGHVHDEELGTWRSNIYSLPIIGGGDGGAFTNGADMTAFWRALTSGRLLGRSWVDTMLSVQARGEEGELYGLGVWIDDQDEDIVFVQGWDPGVAFYSLYHKKKDRGATWFSNVDVEGRGPLIDAVWETLKA